MNRLELTIRMVANKPTCSYWASWTVWDTLLDTVRLFRSPGKASSNLAHVRELERCVQQLARRTVSVHSNASHTFTVKLQLCQSVSDTLNDTFQLGKWDRFTHAERDVSISQFRILSQTCSGVALRTVSKFLPTLCV